MELIPDSAGPDALPPGIIQATPCVGSYQGWWEVRIGRARKTKRFYLTRIEAAELVRVLSERVLPQ